MRKIKLDSGSPEEVKKFLRNNEHMVWGLILDAIVYAIENDLEEKQVFEFDPPIEELFVLKHSFTESLQKGIVIFEKYEDYEKCGVCLKLIKELSI